MTHSHGGNGAPLVIDPGEDRLAKAVIEHHLKWLRPRVRTAIRRDVDPPTVVKRARLLRHAHQRLPLGICRAHGDEISAYLAGWKGWSRYTYDTHLRSFYRWAVDDGWLDLDPMARMPKPAQPSDDETAHYWEDTDIALALTAPEPYGTAIRLAAYLGLRCGEIARADRRDIRGDRLKVLGKGGKTRTVPISPEVAELVHAANGPLLGRKLLEETLSGQQRPVWRAVGLPDEFSLHAGRHWYATRLLETGATLREVQKLLGHSSIATTERYLATLDKRLGAAVDRLPAVGGLGLAVIQPEHPEAD